jgi:ParB family chromosome partitioning protein
MSKRKALGKGLSSLIPERPRDGASGMLQVDLGLIKPSPDQPRRNFDKEHLQELADSMLTHGVLQPLVVTREGDGYRIVVGERRWRAAALAGLKRIPVLVRDVETRDRLEMALIENIQRQRLNPMEEARAYRMLLEAFDLGHEDLAGRVGKSRSYVSNLLRLLSLDENVQAAVEAGRLSMGHARALAGLEDRDAQRRLATRIVEKGLSVREAEELAARASAPATSDTEAKPARRRDPNIRAAEDKLKQSLGAEVRITGNGRRGRIVVDYVNQKELQRLFEILEKAGKMAPPPAERSLRLPGGPPAPERPA